MAGLEVHWPRDATEWAAWGTLALATATVLFVLESRRSTRELRLARFAEFLPMLRWQRPLASTNQWVTPDGPRYYCGVTVLLTNEGPGPARILNVEIQTTPALELANASIRLPSTLPAGERIEVHLSSGPLLEPVEGGRAIAMIVRYGDLLGEFEYETKVVIDADFVIRLPTGEPGSSARFIDSDERSALERRRRRRVSGPPARSL